MNIYDIAREAGVSITTVSRVLNGKDNVSAATRQKVEAVLNRNSYVPSAIARGLVAKSMKTVAVLTVDVRVPHYARTAYAIEHECSRRGYNVLMCNTGEAKEAGMRYLDTVTEKQVDGVILVGSAHSALNTESRLKKLLVRTPTVVANGRLKLPNSYSVLVDDHMGIGMAVDHLAEKGHEGIVYVRDRNTESAQRKYEGYLAAMGRRGLEPRVLETEPTLAGGLAAAQAFLKMKNVTALVCGEDLTAAGVLKGLLRAGVRVPEQVAVTGYNNSEYAHICEPELTSVDNKPEMVGLMSVQLLESLIGGQADPASVVVQPQLALGQST